MELDAGAREFLSQLSIPCHATTEAAAAAGPYDIVVALNVIEHLPQPKVWLEQISAMTAPGGLVVIWTPNGGQADTFGAGWVGFRVDLDHLSYFSAKNLSKLLVDVGLWPEAVWELSQANLSGFRKTQSGPSRKDRLVQRLKGKPVLSWRFARRRRIHARHVRGKGDAPARVHEVDDKARSTSPGDVPAGRSVYYLGQRYLGGLRNSRRQQGPSGRASSLLLALNGPEGWRAVEIGTGWAPVGRCCSGAGQSRDTTTSPLLKRSLLVETIEQLARAGMCGGQRQPAQRRPRASGCARCGIARGANDVD
jgi:hypothetical protein